MAKKSKNLDAVLNEMLNDAENEMKKTVRSAANQIQKDVYEKAKQDLQQYYKNYTPTTYVRTNRLRRAILPYYADRSDSKKISVEVGVQFDASALTGAYKSKSWYHQSGDKWISRNDSSFNFNSQGNGIPEPAWILDNYLEGIHPRTYYSRKYNESSDTWSVSVLYSPKIDAISPAKLLEDYIDNELTNKIDDYVFESFVERVQFNMNTK